MDETDAPRHSHPNASKDPNTLKACEDLLAKMPIAPEYKEGGGIAAYAPRLDRVLMPNLDKLPRFLCNRFILSLCVMLHKKAPFRERHLPYCSQSIVLLGTPLATGSFAMSSHSHQAICGRVLSSIKPGDHRLRSTTEIIIFSV
jgi:hypothetical protein